MCFLSYNLDASEQKYMEDSVESDNTIAICGWHGGCHAVHWPMSSDDKGSKIGDNGHIVFVGLSS